MKSYERMETKRNGDYLHGVLVQHEETINIRWTDGTTSTHKIMLANAGKTKVAMVSILYRGTSLIIYPAALGLFCLRPD